MPVVASITALALVLAGCTTSGDRSGSGTATPAGTPTGTLAASAVEAAATSGPVGATSTPSTSGSGPDVAGSSTRPAAGSSQRAADRGRSAPAGRDAHAGQDGATARPAADVAACRLLSTDLASAVLAPRRFARTADVDNVCAYTARDGKTLVDLGDLALGRGQSASSILAQEYDGQADSGYRVTRIDVGPVAGVLEDGRPHVAQVVWVQRGRVLTLTVSPAGSSSTDRVCRVAAAIADRLG